MENLIYTDFKEFLSVFERRPKDNNVRLFRGQSCDKPLLPKIARKDPTKDTAQKEREMLAELRRRGTLFIGKELSDDWDRVFLCSTTGFRPDSSTGLKIHS